MFDMADNKIAQQVGAWDGTLAVLWSKPHIRFFLKWKDGAPEFQGPHWHHREGGNDYMERKALGRVPSLDAPLDGTTWLFEGTLTVDEHPPLLHLPQPTCGGGYTLEYNWEGVWRHPETASDLRLCHEARKHWSAA